MNATSITWDNLEVFLATAREGTLSGAADLLGVDRSTVHRRVGALEEELRTRLFDRRRRGYDLTPAGEELFEHVRTIEKEVLAISRKVVGRDQTLAGTVRVATVDDLAVGLLPPILKDFRVAHPRVTVSVKIGTELTDLEKLQSDVAIRFGGRPQSPGVVSRKISNVSTFLYGHRDYLDERGRPTAPEDLSDHDIVRGDESLSGFDAEAFIDEHIDGEQTVFRSNSMLARLAAIQAGLGIGFVAAFMADDDPSLERLDVGNPPTGSTVWMVLHADLRKNARVRAFADFAYDRLVAHRDRFEG